MTLKINFIDVRPKIIEFKSTDSREVAVRWTTLMSGHWNQLCGNVPFQRGHFSEIKDLSIFLIKDFY